MTTNNTANESANTEGNGGTLTLVLFILMMGIIFYQNSELGRVKTDLAHKTKALQRIKETSSIVHEKQRLNYEIDWSEFHATIDRINP